MTGEAIDKLDRYDKIQCDENKIEHIQGKTQSPPSNQAIGMIKTKFPHKKAQLSLYINVFYHYVSFFNMVSKEVASHFYVFCSPVEN
jgi:hypothetical protein